MAINSIISKIKGSNSPISESTRTIKIVKNELVNCQDNFSKLMNIIGTESFNLFTKGNLSFDLLEDYFVQSTILNQQINNLLKEKQEIEKSNQKFIICLCGTKNAKSVNFCPNCGNSTIEKNEEVFLCVCGTSLAVDQTFCLECGRLKE